MEFQKEIVKSIFLSRCGLDKKIGARKTLFSKETPIKIVRDFMNMNHLQGSAHIISSAYTLSLDNEILMCITIGPHHRNNKVMTLNRLCTKMGVTVVGGATKLMKKISEDYDELTSWSDNRWSTGDVYSKLGFKLINETGPEYCWSDDFERYSKQSRKKSATGQPLDMTELEFNRSIGLRRIWDCGKKTWKWNK